MALAASDVTSPGKEGNLPTTNVAATFFRDLAISQASLVGKAVLPTRVVAGIGQDGGRDKDHIGVVVVRAAAAVVLKGGCGSVATAAVQAVAGAIAAGVISVSKRERVRGTFMAASSFTHT